MNFLCQVGFTDKGYRCVCRNGFEGESCKGIEPYTNCLTPGVWRVLWISSDYGDDRIGAKSKKFPTASNKIYTIQNYAIDIRGHLQIVKPPKKIFAKFSYPPKIPESKISNLKISSEFPRHSKSRVTSPAPPPTHPLPPACLTLNLSYV